MRSAGGWRPTAAHARAVLGGVFVVVLAIGLRRPDLVVLAAPLLVAAVSGRRSKPTARPTMRQRLGHATVTEGDATRHHIDVDDPSGDTETVAAVVRSQRWIDLDPAHGQIAVQDDPDGTRPPLDVVVQPTRWGTYTVGATIVVATSKWGAYRCAIPGDGPVQELRVLPRAPRYGGGADARVSTPGLVGGHRAPRRGSGSEFAAIRPFAAGDRLHRIRWPQSLRAGELQVAATWADEDRHVVLLVDAVVDVGVGSGGAGTASSLDVSVRAATAIAEHQLGRGDRVSLVVVGSRRRCVVPPAPGRRQFDRIASTLAEIQPAGVLLGPDRIPRDLGRGAPIVILSPMRTPWALSRAAALNARGLAAVVVDCLPAELEQRRDISSEEAAAWRIDRMRREAQLRKAAESGIAVVPWTNPTDLDRVFRDLPRRRHVRAGWSP